MKQLEASLHPGHVSVSSAPSRSQTGQTLHHGSTHRRCCCSLICRSSLQQMINSYRGSGLRFGAGAGREAKSELGCLDKEERGGEQSGNPLAPS